jgi:hypothetical protein
MSVAILGAAVHKVQKTLPLIVIDEEELDPGELLK